MIRLQSVWRGGLGARALALVAPAAFAQAAYRPPSGVSPAIFVLAPVRDQGGDLRPSLPPGSGVPGLALRRDRGQVLEELRAMLPYLAEPTPVPARWSIANLWQDRTWGFEHDGVLFQAAGVVALDAEHFLILYDRKNQKVPGVIDAIGIMDHTRTGDSLDWLKAFLARPSAELVPAPGPGAAPGGDGPFGQS